MKLQKNSNAKKPKDILLLYSHVVWYQMRFRQTLAPQGYEIANEVEQIQQKGGYFDVWLKKKEKLVTVIVGHVCCEMRRLKTEVCRE